MTELSQITEPATRALVVKRMVALAIEACGHVDKLVITDRAHASELAAGLTRWPINYSVFPGDHEAIAPYIRKLRLGTLAPIRVRKWRLTAPGTRFAFAYWQLSDLCQKHAKLYGKFPQKGSADITLFNGHRVNRLDAIEANNLPRLTRDKIVLKSWCAAQQRHLLRHHPNFSVLELPEWKRYFGKTKKASLGAMRAKVFEEIARGFQRIAPQE